MRNEIWSLISYVGAPHGLSLLHLQTASTLYAYIMQTQRRHFVLIFDLAMNVIDSLQIIQWQVHDSSMSWFRCLSNMFWGLTKIIRVFMVNTSAYYGTVEQQGRLTLHLHLLLWISGSLTPQEIREKIMDVNSDFQKKMVEYLESLCVGQFLTGEKN